MFLVLAHDPKQFPVFLEEGRFTKRRPAALWAQVCRLNIFRYAPSSRLDFFVVPFKG